MVFSKMYLYVKMPGIITLLPPSFFCVCVCYMNKMYFVRCLNFSISSNSNIDILIRKKKGKKNRLTKRDFVHEEISHIIYLTYV